MFRLNDGRTGIPITEWEIEVYNLDGDLVRSFALVGVDAVKAYKNELEAADEELRYNIVSHGLCYKTLAYRKAEIVRLQEQLVAHEELLVKLGVKVAGA